jgi:nucleoside-diphosphate-sugar epimerase
MNNQIEALKGSRILITGGAGFIGSTFQQVKEKI